MDDEMTLVITGASGFLGTSLVPLLHAEGHNLLLVGRNPEALRSAFPGHAVCSYTDLPEQGAGALAVLHLAVLNNDQSATLSAYADANVALLNQVIAHAGRAGIGQLIYPATLHALQRQTDPYAQSKISAEKLLADVDGIDVTLLRLPAVYGDKAYKGRLAMLNKLPSSLRGIAFQVLAAIKPTVHVRQIADAVTATLAGKHEDRIISDGQRGNLVFASGKKLIDLAFVAFVVVFLWWALMLVWIAVRFTSPGPAIFAQDRVGKGGKVFTCYKFRTMHQGTRQAGTHEMTAASITKVGNFLRKTKLDEFPQIWNILKNEVSLIGPRPCLPVQDELVAQRHAWGVFDVLPGISGLAQCQGIDMSDPVRLARKDAEYIACRTLPLELKIIVATATGGGQGDKVQS